MINEKILHRWHLNGKFRISAATITVQGEYKSSPAEPNTRGALVEFAFGNVVFNAARVKLCPKVVDAAFRVVTARAQPESNKVATNFNGLKSMSSDDSL